MIDIAGMMQVEGTPVRIERKDGSLVLILRQENGSEAIIKLDPLKEGDVIRLGDLDAAAPRADAASEPKAQSEAEQAHVSAIGEPGDITLYTDGACSGNPGPAGAGWVAVMNGEKVDQGRKSLGHGTNQMAEILAAAIALESIPAGSRVKVLTDSQYVVNTMMMGWKRKANREHWHRLDQAAARHAAVLFEHVRGHNGDQWNEVADSLATAAAY